MDRITASEQKYQLLFGDFDSAFQTTDPEFQEILNRFIFGEVFQQGSLDDLTRELITLAVLTTNQTLPQLRAPTPARR